MTQNNIVSKEWLQAEQERIKKEKEENSKYVTLKQGENTIKLDLSVRPEFDAKAKFGGKWVWQTTATKMLKGVMTPMLLSASPTLHALIISALAEGHNPFTLIKVGEGKETRYAIKELES